MADNSKIEWTDASWNPIRARNKKTGKVGWHCEHATTGCEFCYAEGFNKRLGTGLAFKPGHRNDIELFLDTEMLKQPLHWKRPRLIFPCSMTDLFADFVPDEWLFEIFAVMGACDDQSLGHQFQVLTKRATRMQRWVSTHGSRAWNSCRLGPNAWPARNLWLGVSTERQQEADERIPLLLQTPAAVRFISAEPLLGPIDLTSIEVRVTEGKRIYHDYLHALLGERTSAATGCITLDDGPKLDWVICGGESGPRPMHPDWARSLRDHCAAANVPFFFKQWGAWWPAEQAQAPELRGTEHEDDRMVRVGKKIAGRLLDGIEHNGMPGRPAAREMEKP